MEEDGDKTPALVNPYDNGRIRMSNIEDEDVEMLEFKKPQYPRNMQCGVFSWRPNWLQPCANMKAFTVTLSLWSLFGSINFSYYTSVITQIEREFGLSSSITGFIKNVDNIGFMATVLIFSHFCREANKPRLFAIATLVSSGAIFLFAVPHFIYGMVGRDEIEKYYNSTHNFTETKQATEMCDGVHEEDNIQFCRKSSMRSFNVGALVIFIASELLQGLAQSPKFPLTMTYMDDNAKDDSPKYFSFMFSMRAFSPVMGFMLGAWTTSVYVDLTDPGFGRKDPRFVGAWWLGFVICAACSLFWALPMVLFPPVLRGGSDEDEAVDTNQQESLLDKTKDLPRAMGRILSNKLFLALLLALAFEVYLVGYFTFLPKYLEQYYGVTASVASIITGTVGAFAWSLGPIISGRIMGCAKKITPYFAMKVVWIITALTLVGYVVMLFLACPEDQWAGDIDRDSPDLRLDCNGNCTCDSLSFVPVCGDGMNYFSPCHAGCTAELVENGTTYYTGCGCIGNGNGTAVDGVCPKQCNTLIPYAIMLFLTKFIASMDIIPTMTLFMRCVDHKDKALSLAIVSGILQIVSFPAPILFGMAIDSACLVLQGTCSARKSGACLLYDGSKFRIRLHGFTLLAKGGALAMYTIALFLSRSFSYTDQGKVGDKENNRESIGPVRGDADDDQEELVVWNRVGDNENNRESIGPIRGDDDDDQEELVVWKRAKHDKDTPTTIL